MTADGNDVITVADADVFKGLIGKECSQCRLIQKERVGADRLTPRHEAHEVRGKRERIMRCV